jgi:hypothetical protein
MPGDDSRAGEGHAEKMALSPGRYAARRQEIRERLAAIGERLEVLRLRPDRPPGHGAWLEAARASLAAEERATLAATASQRALRLSARAHERAALVHERAIADGRGDAAEHQRRAEQHRSAALADDRRIGPGVHPARATYVPHAGMPRGSHGHSRTSWRR